MISNQVRLKTNVSVNLCTYFTLIQKQVSVTNFMCGILLFLEWQCNILVSMAMTAMLSTMTHAY